jgi:hypothetical protein
VASHETLAAEARRIALEWVETGAARRFRGGSQREELKTVNASESIALADAFLSSPFLRAQLGFLLRKRKWAPAAMFLLMLISRPAWSRLL